MALHARTAITFAIAMLGAALAGKAMATPADNVPPELQRLIPRETTLLDHQIADLNGDGRPDIVFVVEAQSGQSDDNGLRTLFIAVRQPDGSLKTVKRSDKVVYCRQCGGVFGDPFAGLEAVRGKFSVNHYGGSNWRWSNSFSFAYSRRDDSWQLIRVDESSFHTANPNKMKSKTYKPPKDFGKIDISDFDPENFKGQGPR